VTLTSADYTINMFEFYFRQDVTARGDESPESMTRASIANAVRMHGIAEDTLTADIIPPVIAGPGSAAAP